MSWYLKGYWLNEFSQQSLFKLRLQLAKEKGDVFSELFLGSRLQDIPMSVSGERVACKTHGPEKADFPGIKRTNTLCAKLGPVACHSICFWAYKSEKKSEEGR